MVSVRMNQNRVDVISNNYSSKQTRKNRRDGNWPKITKTGLAVWFLRQV